MNDLINAVNAALHGRGECVAVTRLQEGDGTVHHTAHVHVPPIHDGRAPGAKLPSLLHLMAQLGCHSVSVAMVLQDPYGTQAGQTPEGCLHLAFTFQRANERVRAQVSRLMTWLASPRASAVNHVTQANLLELAGIEPNCQSMELLRAAHEALLQAGWVRYVTKAAARGPYERRPTPQWLYRRPEAPAAAAAHGG